jgi:hypothetical protein
MASVQFIVAKGTPNAHHFNVGDSGEEKAELR